MARLRLVFRWSALVTLLATLGWWTTAGAHRGWSMNRVPVTLTDEITGIAYVEYEDRFVPGIDVLIGGLGLTALAWVTSCFLRPKSKTN